MFVANGSLDDVRRVPPCDPGRIESLKVIEGRPKKVQIEISSAPGTKYWTNKQVLFSPLHWAYKENVTVMLRTKDCKKENYGFAEFEILRD